MKESHEHVHHHHHHNVTLTNVNRAFVIGITLNFLFVVIEVITGLYIHSLSLLSDAGHNLADVGALALSLLAFRLMKVKSNKKYTYGYRKTSILVALFNAAVLLISIGAIVYEALHRLLNPEELPGKTIAIVAGIGIVINTVTALFFFSNKEKDLNIKSAYLHLMSDAVVSLGLVIGGIVIFYTNWFWIDSLLSIIIAIVILLSTWHLLKSSLRLSLDGVPEGISLDDIKATAMKVPGVAGLHHIHIWAISTTENALTAHLVINNNATNEQEKIIKHELKHALQHKNIHHITLETERENEPCGKEECRD
ncbi:cation transporter [Panacibacter ginsenosidivorans]|uniref:Cation transporter n=1 Tax=Panacibacter ginsenosidivorans TaxID=1813871 RepID=A0A5B8V712_9BACT|nr:cation diffusion facilitator family transporter [Panacibacter ginsenosidivorans]QEC66561.1 cation transporter [Panacibacter ginsenosidivorans]